MREIETSNSFEKDYKRLKANPQYSKTYKRLLLSVIPLLAQDKTLAQRHRDHALTGNWKGYRECHLKPDLLLIYEKNEPEILRLVRMGSHSEIFKK